MSHNDHDAEMTSEQSRGLRGFWSLFVTQFQGAFSDNVLKNLVVFMMLGLNVSLAEKHAIGEKVTGLFSLPFILFSMAGGYLADRCSKRQVMIGVKIFEIFVMLVALAGLAWNNITLLLACVFFMGTHSAFFGPSKYGSLPELLPEKRLSWGNGLLELGTFMAIILGTVAAAAMSDSFHSHQTYSGLVLVALALIGLTTSLTITRIPPADPAKVFHPNFLGGLFRQMGGMRQDRPLALAAAGNTYFSFLGALLLLNLFFYGADVLHVKEMEIGYLNVALALGIGLGSVAAGYLSGGKIEYGLVPLGAIGLSIVSVSLSARGLSMAGALVRLSLLGFAGGFFIVPISAILQHRPSKDKKGELLAAANLLSFVGVFLVWPVHYLLAQVAHINPLHIFLFGGVLTFAGAVYAIWLLPDSLLRFLLWIATHSIYRIKVLGRDNIPAKGGALFVCNHLSLVDAMLLLASTDRHVRFIVYKGMYDLPWIKPFARILRAIPISSELRPREMLQSLRTASEAIRNGEVVCIFAEGQITRIGQMLPFRRGFERIVKDLDVPVVPVALDGVWGSIFSFEQGRFLWKWPHHIPYPVTVSYGKALPHTASPPEVRQAVQELLAGAWHERKLRMLTIHRAFARTARRHPFRFAMADAQTPKLRFIAAFARTIFLARRLKRVWAGQRMVGLLLPPSVPGALANFAAMLLGRVPVNLNYTLSEEALASCARQSSLTTILTSRTLLERLKLKLPCTTLFLEDIAAAPGFGERLAAILSACLLPAGLLEGALSWGVADDHRLVTSPSADGPSRESREGMESSHAGPLPKGETEPLEQRGLLHSGLRRSLGFAPVDELATIIFSSGSTGSPKGVMLTHYNIGSNIDQLEQVFALDKTDRVLGILPFFHSFGFTGTLCLPAALGVGVVYYPNPLDPKAIGPLVNHYNITFLLATPTFLQLYMRGCAPEDFGSLRVVMTGAEKLPDRLAAAFEEQFGIRPLEGYGCTECAPVVAVNTRDFRAAGFRQVGAKRGRIGHPLPGVCVSIVDADTFAPVPVGQPGLLLVRGPNIMQGYLGQPQKTAEVLRDGWYVTGDIAALDEDGFLQITDRLSRFSKIGGEMVPHIKVEEKLQELAGATEQTFVVTGLPDEKKGERLIVLHKLADGSLAACLEKFAQCDLPNLWKPRADQFFHIDAFPYLGTGKLDLRRVRELASELAGAQKA